MPTRVDGKVPGDPPTVEEAWAAIKKLDRYGTGDAQGSFVYALHAEAAAHAAIIAAHDDACFCRGKLEECPKRARLAALFEGTAGGPSVAGEEE